MKEARRRVTITIQDGNLSYKFEGHWTGKDVKIAMSNLTLNYKLHNREIRRDFLNANKAISESNRDTLKASEAIKPNEAVSTVSNKEGDK